MNVDTVLGTLSLPELATPGAEDCFASSVRLAAKELDWIVSKLPSELQSSAQLLARQWLGDEPSSTYLQALETGTLAALAAMQSYSWAQGISSDLVTEAYARIAEPARPVRFELGRARRLADQGQCDALQARTMRRWVDRHATRTATMGQYRKQTGCKCPNPLQCTCMTLAKGDA